MFYQQFSIYLGYIIPIGDSENLIAPFTIVRETLSASNQLLKIAKNQVSKFYTMIRTHFPNDCEWCYEVLGVTNGPYISQIDGKLLV